MTNIFITIFSLNVYFYKLEIYYLHKITFMLLSFIILQRQIILACQIRFRRFIIYDKIVNKILCRIFQYV